MGVDELFVRSRFPGAQMAATMPVHGMAEIEKKNRFRVFKGERFVTESVGSGDSVEAAWSNAAKNLPAC